MADLGEDCPHRQQLEHTLLQCQTQSELLQATRDNYLSIIEDFQRDLEELTAQVEQQQQQQQQEQEQGYYEDSLRIGTKELELQNERMACQIHSLQAALMDRESQIEQLRTTLNGYVDLNETNKLRDEISELKQRNCEQTRKVLEIASLLRVQEEECQKQNQTNETVMNNYEEQCKELKRANRELKSLQERLCQLEKHQEDLKTERSLLREEVLALKEKEAKSAGRERALTGQLSSQQQELDNSRRLLQDMKCHLKKEERQHRETMERLSKANDEIREEMRAVAAECKQMQLKLKQQTNVNEQQELIIESFRKWKDAQVRSDEAMRQCIKRAEEHITLLLEENQRLCEEYKRLFTDYSILEVEMSRIKEAVRSRFEPPICEEQSSSDKASLKDQKSEDAMSLRMQYMEDTTRRISAQNQLLSNSNSNFNLCIPSSRQANPAPEPTTITSQSEPTLPEETTISRSS